MMMFCTKCGAELFEGDRFCLKCGSSVKHTESTSAEARYIPEPIPQPEPQIHRENFDPTVMSVSPERINRIMQEHSAGGTEAKSPSAGRTPVKKKKRGKGLVIALAIVIALLVAVGVLSDYLNESTPRGILNGVIGCWSSGASEEAASGSDVVSEADTVPESMTETTATAEHTTTTTTTTTAATTTASTTSQADLLKEQAEEIRNLLTSKKWTTTLEGYKAVITFKTDGKATVDIYLSTLFGDAKVASLDAAYSVDNNCFAKIKASYQGKDYGISGIISKISSKELRVDRGTGKDSVTLKAQ